MAGSGLDPTDDFQTLCELGLDQNQFWGIKSLAIGLGLKIFTVQKSAHF